MIDTAITRDMLGASTDELMKQAARLRSAATGNRITYSPKVFIPLTMLCADKCGYCTFAQPPARLESPYLEPEQVLAIARAGARAGCHEALFTLGERPEDRYPIAREWLASRGYDSTVEYLAEMCRLVLADTGLLPHANAGALSLAELKLLRGVSVSQGMMVESLRGDLECHRGSPDKTPERRLSTLNAAGELQIPFTTGILVGIGENEADRTDALVAIAASHERHGHIQEVIVQNFLPKSGTAMHRADPCPAEDYLRAIALARIILPSDIHLQAPPNLSDDFGVLLDAGIDDWGGVSPVTADHVNPERPWPAVDRIRGVTESKGFTLAPRLTIYPELASHPERFLDETVRFAVMDRSDAERLARDDPGAIFPERTIARKVVGTGAEVTTAASEDHRSTIWCSGAPVDPPELIISGTPPARIGNGTITGQVAEVLDGIGLGQDLGIEEVATLFSARGPEVRRIAELADELRFRAVGDEVTFVRNRNINYTNVCTFKCRFCGFSKGPMSLNLRGTPYLLTLEEMQRRVIEAEEKGATEVCLVGGIHPDFDGDYYIDVCRAVKDVAPEMHLHAFTALEVTEGARRLGEPLETYLRRLMDAGLRSLPGTAAEILDDEVRQILCPDKINTEEWLYAHRVAHSIGLRSNITIMFGAVESPISWARHLVATRDLQRETGGFTEFVGLPFVHMATPLYLQRKARRGPTFRETLLMHSIARIVYDGIIDNIQASWVKIGFSGVRQLLASGANDLGGTLMDENISRAAGAEHGTDVSAEDFAALVEPLGRTLVQRTTLYGRASGHQSGHQPMSTTSTTTGAELVVR